jgi:hypothetical protein
MNSLSSIQSSIKSDAFSASTKLEVKRIAGETCWACGNDPAQVCHVIAKEDPQVQLWAEKGLINFSLISPINAIPLCPLCHAQFDLAIDPGFVFFPSDLEFFINFELADRQRRSEAAREGANIPRQVPTAEQYKSYQVEKGVISSGEIGGLYQRVFLKEYHHRGLLPFDITAYFTLPKSWHGSPMASLRRAIPLIGTVRLGRLKKETRQELEKLRDLYFSEGEEETQGIETKPPDPNELLQKRQSDTTLHKPGPTKKQRPNENNGEASADMPLVDVGTRYSTFDLPWVLGPHVSTEEVVNRYSPICARSLGLVEV